MWPCWIDYRLLVGSIIRKERKGETSCDPENGSERCIVAPGRYYNYISSNGQLLSLVEADCAEDIGRKKSACVTDSNILGIDRRTLLLW